MTIRPLPAAWEANLDAHRRIARNDTGKPGIHHELAVPTIHLERGDCAAAVALEEVDHQPFEFLP